MAGLPFAFGTAISNQAVPIDGIGNGQLTVIY
jgi:hypothetical protein